MPLQEPVAALSRLPSIRLPVTLGRPTLDAIRAPMRLVAADVADVDPAALVAVTTVLIVPPTSPEMSLRVEPISPLIALQAPPLLLHSSHA